MANETKCHSFWQKVNLRDWQVIVTSIHKKPRPLVSLEIMMVEKKDVRTGWVKQTQDFHPERCC